MQKLLGGVDFFFNQLRGKWKKKYNKQDTDKWLVTQTRAENNKKSVKKKKKTPKIIEH